MVQPLSNEAPHQAPARPGFLAVNSSSIIQRQSAATIDERYDLNLFGEGAQKNLTSAQALAKLKKIYARLKLNLESDVYRHSLQREIREDQWIVGSISDALGLTKMPGDDIWIAPKNHLAKAEALLSGQDVISLAEQLRTAEASWKDAHQTLFDYIRKTEGGAEAAVTGLEFVRDVSFLTVGAAATVATGGLGGVAIGTGVGTLGNIAQQGTETFIGLRKDIDWAGISFDAFFGVLTGIIGGKLGGMAAGKIIGANPLAASLGKKTVARLIDSIVSGRASAVIQSSARNLFDNLRGSPEAMDMDTFLKHLIDDLTNPRSYFMDILAGEMTHHMASRSKSPSTQIPPKKESAESSSEAPKKISSRPAKEKNGGSSREPAPKPQAKQSKKAKAAPRKRSVKTKDPADLPDISDRFKTTKREAKLSNGKEVEIVETSGKLGVPGKVKVHRDTNEQRRLSSGTGDDAGHRIGDRFGAPGNRANLSLQNWKANQYGTFKKLENHWAQLLKRGVEVDASVADFFQKGEKRPYKRKVTWTETDPKGKTQTFELEFGNFETARSREAAGALKFENEQLATVTPIG